MRDTGIELSRPAGLLNLSPTNGGTVTDDLDALVDAIATVEDASGVATHIIASPTGWAELSKFKDETTSNRSLIGAGTEAATRTLLSVPVVVSNSIPDAGLVVLDKASVLSVYGQVLLATSTDFYFGSDNVALRATFRFGAAIADTERLVKLTVAGAGSSAGTSAPRPIRVVTEGRRFPGVASSVFNGGKSVRKLGARTWLTSTGLAMSRNRRGPKAIRSMLLHSPAVVPSTRI